MKQNFFFIFITVLISANFSFAQTTSTRKVPVMEVSEIQDGSTYYIRNKTSDLYITSGGNWSTQAVLNSEGLKATARLNTTTSLYRLEFSGSTKTLFRDDLNGMVYTDQAKDNYWNIQMMDAENLTYTIQAPSSYGGYKANQYLAPGKTKEATNTGDYYAVKYNRDKEEYADYIEWQFVNLSLYEARVALYKALNNAMDSGVDMNSYDRIYETSIDPKQIAQAAIELDKLVFNDKITNATTENPADLTYYLLNPDFRENTGIGWEGVGTVNYHEVEFYQKTFNMYQEISGFPAGKYTMKAQGFERPKANDGGAAYRAGTETIYARFYAKSSSFPERSIAFNSIYKHKYSGNNAVNGYVNTMAGAEVMLVDPDNYSIVLSDILLAEGDKLTIGARSEFQQNSYWVLFDNFRLEYHGFDVNDMIAFLNEKITEAEALLLKKMQSSEATKINAALEEARKAIRSEPPVTEALDQANSRLQEAIETAKISIKAYDDLELAIDEANSVYDKSKQGADEFKIALDKAKTLAGNLEASLETLAEETEDLYNAIFVFRLANGSGLVPTVVTNPNYARGATQAFGRSTISGVTSSSILERGFCWATHPEPTVLDYRTTKNFTNNGIIYHIENLKPATVYYMRAYALTKDYAVGYGDVIKVITIPKGTVSYSLDGGLSGEHRTRVDEAMASAVDYFNNLTSIKGHRLNVYFGSGTPTAEASYGGYMRFGPSASYQRTGTALHEMGHTIGVGQHSLWYGPSSPLRETGSRGNWLGERANKVVQFFENNTTGTLTGDNTHMWPYGINGAHEDSGSEILYIANSLIHQALGEDGLPPTGGFTTPAYTFESDENRKYYIKNEDEDRGRETSYLIEDESGKLILKVMTEQEVLKNDSAAWYFNFNPATCYYHIRNAATGKYFTYKSAGANGFGLVEKNTPSASENFQLMGARVNTKVGSGDHSLIAKGYWIIRPEHKLNPSCFGSLQSGQTTSTTFNLGNSATTQRWLLLTGEEISKLETGWGNAIPEVDSVNRLIEIISGEGGIWISSSNKAICDISIYTITGQVVKTVSIFNDRLFVPLTPGVYIILNQKIAVVK